MFNQIDNGSYFGGVSTDIQLGDSNTEYVRSLPTPASVGGCPSGTTFAGTVQDALDKILYPYQNPQVSLSSSVATTTRQLGVDTISSLILTATCVKKTGVLQRVELYQNANLLTTINCVEGTLVYTYEVNVPITSSVNFTAKVYDASQKTSVSNAISYNFYYPNFSVTSTEEIANITMQDIDVGNMRLEASTASKALTFTGVMSRYIYAYPKVWGNLTSILDKSGFEYLNAFQKVEMIYMSGSDSVPMNVYISKELCNLNSFIYTFKI